MEPAPRPDVSDQHLRFPEEGEPSIAYTETDIGIQEVAGTEHVAMYSQSFDRAVDGALEPDDTTLCLRQLALQTE